MSTLKVGKDPHVIVDVKAPVQSPAGVDFSPNAKGHGALYAAKAKRLTLTAVQEEWSRLLAHANALSKRQARARQAKDDRKLAVLADLERQAQAKLQDLAAKIVELGGQTIHPKVEEQHRKLANWRAKDVRRHKERKASPVRYVTMPDGYPIKGE